MSEVAYASQAIARAELEMESARDRLKKDQAETATADLRPFREEEHRRRGLLGDPDGLTGILGKDLLNTENLTVSALGSLLLLDLPDQLDDRW